MLDRVKPLMDYIGHHEARGNYDAIWHGIRRNHFPPKPLTQMSVGQVLAWQDSIDRHYQSEAAGKYQQLEDTLRGLYANAGVALDDPFDEHTQDKLCLALLGRRGLYRYLSGTLSDYAFAQNLSMEWASLPCVIKDKRGRRAVGQSYYAGDGLNKSGAGIPPFMAVVREIAKRPVAAPIVQEVPVSKAETTFPEIVSYEAPGFKPDFAGLFGSIIRLVLAGFGQSNKGK